MSLKAYFISRAAMLSAIFVGHRYLQPIYLSLQSHILPQQSMVKYLLPTKGWRQVFIIRSQN